MEKSATESVKKWSSEMEPELLQSTLRSISSPGVWLKGECHAVCSEVSLPGH
jgi:hypothetical protein